MPNMKQVLQLMEEKNLSMLEAQRVLVKQELMDTCQEATTFSELQSIVLRLINIIL